MTVKRIALATVSIGALIGFGAVAQKQPAAAQTAQQQSHPSASDHSGTMQRSDRDMRQVLGKLQELGAKPIGTQSVEETRKGPTPADAVTALLKDQGKAMPTPKVKK